MRNLFLVLTVMAVMGCNQTTKPTDATANNKVLEKLFSQHELWQNTPYVLGGLSRRGVDCSGFVQLTMQQKFGLQLPRTTEAQSRLPQTIERHKLQAGDLVFFKIPGQGKIYHVGIYLAEGRFLHASTSRGVMVSDLGSAYWRNNYWQAKRVLP